MIWPHHIPVAIDILRSGDSTTSLLIVGHLVADAIVGGRVGLPITLIAAAITSLSFMGFGGIVENLFNVTL